MSLLIKGMRLPKNCDVCIFSDWSNLHQTAACKICEYDPCFDDFSKAYLSERAMFCPLMEVKMPHGRLFDESEVKKCLQELPDSEDKWSAIALLEWAIEKRWCIEAEGKT